MKQIFRNRKGEISVDEVAMPKLERGQAIIKLHYSVISSGTEMRSLSTTKENSSQQKKNPKKMLKLLKVVRQEGLQNAYKRIQSRIQDRVPLGYSCVGQVVKVAKDIKDIKRGDLVACMGAEYASHAEYVAVPRNLMVKVLKNADLEEAACITIGCIALHAVRNAKTQLGETVLVVGLGLIGQMVTQLLKVCGVRVIGIDTKKERVILAKKLGADEGIQLEEGTELTNVDAVIFCATNTKGNIIEKAARACRDRARFVVVGNIDLHLPWEIFYKKELEMVVSRSTGPGRHDKAFEVENQEYPTGYVRWTEQQNAREIINLLATKKLHFKPLLTKKFSFLDAEKAYSTLLQGNSIGVVLDYTKTK